jgi:hypothetical protein
VIDTGEHHDKNDAKDDNGRATYVCRGNGWICQLGLIAELASRRHSRVPTSHRAKMKLKMRAVDPRGATQSGRRYFSAKGEPTGKVSLRVRR